MGKVVTLGEIMLRLSTEKMGRIQQSNEFEAHYGGGEANVAVSLANFGHQVYFASKVPDNSLGTAVYKHLRSYGVGTDYLLVGGERLGTYYMETGIGERAAKVIYDRKGSSFAMMSELEWDLDKLFLNVDVFHISGITPALSVLWREWLLDLIKKAKQAGAKISFDINYRQMLWSTKEASETLQRILPFVDYCSAGRLDAYHLLRIQECQKENETEELIACYQKMHALFPTIELFYSTKRTIHSASDNELIGTVWSPNEGYQESKSHHIHPIVDRVGGGDAFAAGILHGVLNNWELTQTVQFATAASALKHTVHGDCNQFNETEVSSFMTTGSGKILR